MSALIESKILAGLIQSDAFIKTMHKDTHTRFFSTKVGKEITTFCLDYFKKFDEAPKAQIDDLLDKMVKQDRPSEELKDVISIIDRLANKTDVNEKYLTDTAYSFFRSRDALELSERIKEAAVSEDETTLASLVNSYKLVDKPETVGVSPFDEDIFLKAMAESNEPVFKCKGQYGEFINPELYRGAYVTFIAPTKGGKSWYLMDLAIKALEAGVKVAYLQAGDMTEGQFINRFFTSILKNNYRDRYCASHWSPVPDCVYNQNDTCTDKDRDGKVGLFTGEATKEVEQKSKKEILEAMKQTTGYKPCKSCMNCPRKKHKFNGSCYYIKKGQGKPYSAEDIAKVTREEYKDVKDNFKLASYPTDRLSPAQIETLMDGWAKYDDFVPDIILIDYLDILTVENKLRDNRETVKNMAAKGLRTVAIKYNVCLVTATQSDTAGFDQKTLNMKNFRDESKILTHFTCLIGINQTPEEKEKGMVRLNKIMSRDEEASSQQLKATQNFYRGRPLLQSWF